MNLFILRYYIVVYETGSMAQAAERLSLSRQALSKAVLTLEDELGLRLLTRNRSGVTPTPAGDVLYRHAQTLLKDWDQALAELETVRLSQRSALRVGYGAYKHIAGVASDAVVFRFASVKNHLVAGYVADGGYQCGVVLQGGERVAIQREVAVGLFQKITYYCFHVLMLYYVFYPPFGGEFVGVYYRCQLFFVGHCHQLLRYRHPEVYVFGAAEATTVYD